MRSAILRTLARAARTGFDFLSLPAARLLLRATFSLSRFTVRVTSGPENASLAAFAAPAIAPVNTAITNDDGQSPIIQVDRRCGRFSHYVPAHRDRHHRLIRGVCVHD